MKERSKIDYLVIANIENYKKFCKKYKDCMVSRARKFKIHSGEWLGIEFKIEKKTIILLLDYELK